MINSLNYEQTNELPKWVDFPSVDKNGADEFSNEVKKISQIAMDCIICYGKAFAKRPLFLGGWVVSITIISSLPTILSVPGTCVLSVFVACKLINVLYSLTTNPEYRSTIEKINYQQELCYKKINFYNKLISYVKSKNENFCLSDFMFRDEIKLSYEEFINNISNYLNNQDEYLKDERIIRELKNNFNFFDISDDQFFCCIDEFFCSILNPLIDCEQKELAELNAIEGEAKNCKDDDQKLSGIKFSLDYRTMLKASSYH